MKTEQALVEANRELAVRFEQKLQTLRNLGRTACHLTLVFIRVICGSILNFSFLPFIYRVLFVYTYGSYTGKNNRRPGNVIG
jgi:hypothetical protein